MRFEIGKLNPARAGGRLLAMARCDGYSLQIWLLGARRASHAKAQDYRARACRTRVRSSGSWVWVLRELDLVKIARACYGVGWMENRSEFSEVFFRDGGYYTESVVGITPKSSWVKHRMSVGITPKAVGETPNVSG
jgi:hypothetical protein